MRYDACMTQIDIAPFTLRAWTRLAAAHKSIDGEIERALKGAGLPAAATYDILQSLEQAPEQRLRPAEIEKALALAQYALSRLLDRIEALAQIQRVPCADDARGQWIVLAPAGAEARAKMHAVLAGVLNARIGEELGGDNAKKLGKLLGKLLPQ